jgi:hypothetical protein
VTNSGVILHHHKNVLAYSVTNATQITDLSSKVIQSHEYQNQIPSSSIHHTAFIAHKSYTTEPIHHTHKLQMITSLTGSPNFTLHTKCKVPSTKFKLQHHKTGSNIATYSSHNTPHHTGLDYTKFQQRKVCSNRDKLRHICITFIHFSEGLA